MVSNAIRFPVLRRPTKHGWYQRTTLVMSVTYCRRSAGEGGNSCPVRQSCSDSPPRRGGCAEQSEGADGVVRPATHFGRTPARLLLRLRPIVLALRATLLCEGECLLLSHIFIDRRYSRIEMMRHKASIAAISSVIMSTNFRKTSVTFVTFCGYFPCKFSISIGST